MIRPHFVITAACLACARSAHAQRVHADVRIPVGKHRAPARRPLRTPAPYVTPAFVERPPLVVGAVELPLLPNDAGTRPRWIPFVAAVPLAAAAWAVTRRRGDERPPAPPDSSARPAVVAEPSVRVLLVAAGLMLTGAWGARRTRGGMARA